MLRAHRMGTGLTAALVVLLAACSGTRVGSSGGPTAETMVWTSGSYGGRLTVEDSDLEGLLELQRRDRSVHAAFRSSSMGIDASGDGRLDGDRLDLVLAYDMDCRGELRMRGVFDLGRDRYSGEVVASDCTGDARGRFVFVRSVSR